MCIVCVFGRQRWWGSLADEDWASYDTYGCPFFDCDSAIKDCMSLWSCGPPHSLCRGKCPMVHMRHGSVLLSILLARCTTRSQIDK